MIIYKFYLPDDNGKRDVLIGVLPERRTIRQRITDESIMNWVRKMPFREEVDPSKVYFVPVVVNGPRENIEPV